MNDDSRPNADDAIVLDLDGTLTVDDKAAAYPDKPVNAATLAAAHAARERGYRVVVATSRNMRTYRGDLEQIRRHTQPVIEQWLAREGLAPDALAIGKTWCGPRGFYVDDRNMHVEEFVFRFQGPYAGCLIDALYLPAAMDLQALAAAHVRHRKLERLFRVARFIYPRPRQEEALPCELRDDARIEWASIAHTDDDTACIDCLTRVARSDWLLIVGSRQPIDVYAQLLVHQERLAEFSRPAIAAGYKPHDDSVSWLLAPRALARQACAVAAAQAVSLGDLAGRLGAAGITWLLDPSGAAAQPPWASSRADSRRAG
ncbi:MAG: HAD hydrolase family protein [Planctomycetia bacterium]|nr:HAD hydrolase family protein [Planctomycetia bacterium]